jgi:uncharacterized protein with FMN-binding domain
MKRAPIVLTATAAGLAATLGFHPHSKAATATVVTTSTAASSPTTTTTTASAKTVTSEAVSTRYGDVQLKLTISGGRVTSVQALQLPSSDPKSSQISSYAEPQLRQSALTAQSANIDAVSGATYTSAGYRTALQSALDTAGLGTTSSAG